MNTVIDAEQQVLIKGELADWLTSISDKTYRTPQQYVEMVLRSAMNAAQRRQLDTERRKLGRAAWAQQFGRPQAGEAA